MQALRRHAVMAFTLLALTGIAVWLVYRPIDRIESASGVVVVSSADKQHAALPSGSPTTSTSDSDPELAAMRLAAGSDAKLTDVRIVDQEWRIACGLRSGGAGVQRSARVVWIGSTKTLVVDDGGADFARLVKVCA